MKSINKKQIIIAVLIIITVFMVTEFYIYNNNQPSKEWLATFKNSHCIPKQEKAFGVRVWIADCNFEMSSGIILPSKTFNGFEYVVDGKPEGKVIEIFEKDKNAPIDVLMPELITRGTPKDDCEFKKIISINGDSVDIYEIIPTGKRKTTFDEQARNGDFPDAQCGSYGANPNGNHYFEIHKSNQSKVLFIYAGQYAPFFDQRSVVVE